MSAPLYNRNFWLLYVAHFSIAFSLLSFVLLPLRIEELGGAEFDIGWIAATGGAAGVLVRWLTGHLTDRVGRRQVMLVAALVNATASFLFIGVHQLWPAFYLVRALHGMADGALFGAFFTVISDLTPPARRAEGIAVFGTSGLTASWVGPFLGELAIARGGYTLFFLLCGGFGLLALVLIARLPETRGRLPAVGFDRSFLRHPGLVVAFVYTLLFGVALGAYFNFLAPHLERVGGGLQASDFLLPYTLAALGLRLLGRRLPDRLGVRRLLPPAFAALLAGIALIGLARDLWTLRLAGLAGGLGHGYVFPLLNTLVVRRTPAAVRGLAVSLFTALVDLGALVAGPCLAAVVARWGYARMFPLTAGAVAAGVVATMVTDRLLGRRERRRRPPPAAGSTAASRGWRGPTGHGRSGCRRRAAGSRRRAPRRRDR